MEDDGHHVKASTERDLGPGVSRAIAEGRLPAEPPAEAVRLVAEAIKQIRADRKRMGSRRSVEVIEP